MPTSLIRLYEEQGQSPWLDNLTRPSLHDGTMRGPHRPRRSRDHRQPHDHRQGHRVLGRLRPASPPLATPRNTVEDAYWDLAVADVTDALELLRPTFDASESADGFVSIEVAPELARRHSRRP